MNARPTPLSWLGTLATLAVLALPGLAFAAPDAGVLSPAVRLIDADAARGAITVSEAARQKLYYLFERDRLAPEYAIEGDLPAKCGTAILAEVGAQLDELDAETRAFYEEKVVQGPGGDEVNVLHVLETTHFYIQYDDVGTNAVPLADVAPANGIPDFIEKTAEALEYSWTASVDGLGYLGPQLTGGPNNKYDIRFQDQASYGFTTVVSGQRTRIVLHPNFLGFPPNDDPDGDQIGALRVTIVHELKHAIQRMYTNWTEGGWVELDATWIEDIVYDGINDYYNFISGTGSPFTSPSVSLDNGGSGSYEDCNFEHYQTEKHGNGHMLAFWLRRQAFPAEAVLTTYTQNYLASGSNFNDAWGEYVAWNFAAGTRAAAGYGYGEAANYPTSPVTSSHTSLPIATTGGSVARMAAHSRLIVNGGGTLSGQPEFTFTGAAATNWRVTVVALKNNGQIATTPVPLAGGAGTLLVTDPQFELSNVQWIALVIGNPATAGAAASYTFSARAVAPVFVSHSPLWDTADDANPVQVAATFTPGTTTLDASSPYLAYQVDLGPTFVVPMIATGNPDEYAAAIPAQTVGKVVGYRITGASVLGDSVRTPADPAGFHTYQVVTVFEPFETAGGWTVGDVGDGATTGVWERVVPVGSQAAPDADFTGPPGSFAFVTQNGSPGGAIGEADVDGGKTTLLSPVYDLSVDGPYSSVTARYRRWYWNRLGTTVDDVWRADVSNDGGSNWVNVETIADGGGGWALVNVDLAALLGVPDLVRFRFVAEDFLGGSVIEGGIDDFEIIAIPQTAVSVTPGGGGAVAQLGPATPNPAVSSVAVSLSLPRATTVKATVRDIQGRTIRTLVDGALPAGATTLQWNGAGERGNRAATGVYFVRVDTGEISLERKVVLVR